MKQFSNVLSAYREWILSIPFFRVIQPYAIYILCIAIGIDFFDEVFYTIFNRSFGIINFIDTLAYFGYYIGFLLVLTTTDIKLAPYALFAKAFILLFPFTYFGLHTIISCFLYIFLGVQLLRFTATEYIDHSKALEQHQ